MEQSLTLETLSPIDTNNSSDEPPGYRVATGDTGLSMRELTFRVDGLRTAVLARRPTCKQILDRFGHESVYQYVRRCTTEKQHTPDLRRQEEFLEAFYQEVEEKLDRTVAKSATAQLRKYYTASTMDHSSPICHPWAFHFDLAAASVYRADPDPILKNIITLAFSNVSLNNFAFPRGFSFHSHHKGAMHTHRHAFFVSKYSRCSVFNLQPYTAEDIERINVRIHADVQSGDMPAVLESKMKDIVQSIYARPDVLACTSYADQLAKTNFHLWRRLNASVRGKQIDLVYLQQESLVTRLLLKHHLTKDTAINRFIFDLADESVATRCFDGVHDAFSMAKKRGTYLFWALCPKGKQRIQLWKKGNALVSDCGAYNIPLTPESIATYLKNHELIPSTLLSLCILSFYYGLHCLGGLGQVTYLPEMKAAYLKMMQEIGDGAAPHNCAPLDTQNLGGEMATAFVESPTGNVVPATLFDFLLYGQGSSMVERASAMLQDTTLSTALMSTMPDDYPMLYSTEERDPKIHATTAAHIARVLKERGQIQACGSMEEEISLRPIHIPVPTRFPRLAPVLSRNTLKVA